MLCSLKLPFYFIYFCNWVLSGVRGAEVRRRGLPLGHELCGSLPVVGLHAEKPPAAAGSGLHAPGVQAARNHAPDRGEALHLHRQLHHAAAAPGNHPYLQPSASSPARFISCILLLGSTLASMSPPVLFFPFLHLPLRSSTTLLCPCPGGCGAKGRE